MKIATAIKTALAAFPQKERRIALAQFITRYTTDSTTKITHYRCIGRDADVITAFLTTAGFTSDDYSLVKSDLDPDTCQIRWKKGSKHLNKFTVALSERLHAGASRPAIYRCIEEGVPSRVFSDTPDPEDDTGHTSTSEPHLSEIIQNITDKILEWAQSCVTTIPQAIVWENCAGDGTFFQTDTEQATNETRVHIPQISALEQYVWATGLLPDGVAKPICPIFAFNHKGMTAARYLGLKENVTFTAGIYDAPANMMLTSYPASDYDRNPLRGFLVGTAAQARSNKLVKPDSNAVYILTTGVVDHGLTYEDTLRIIEFIADPRKLWDYITAIYESVYHGLVCTIMPHSHVGVNNNVIQAFPYNIRCATNIIDSDPFYRGEDDPALLTICAGVALARREDIEHFVQSPRRFQDQLLLGDYGVPVESLVQRSNKLEPEHIKIAPDKKDIPAMWFAATHLEPGAITPTRQCMVDAAIQVPEVSLREQAEGMQRFHDLVAQWDTSELSVVKEEDHRNSMEGPCFMAFATGLAAAVHHGLPEATIEETSTWNLTERPSKGHSSSLYVTNVYSGVVTDKSPTLAESVHHGAEAFPSVFDTRYELNEEFARSADGTVETALFTQFVASMSAGTSTAQTTMAPKSEDPHRGFILIAETNFDFYWIKRMWNEEGVREHVIYALTQAFLNRNPQYAASVSPSYRTTGSPYFDQMSSALKKVTGSAWNDAMVAAHLSYSGTDVTFRPDSYGRTYFIFHVHTANAMYAMAMFRFLAGMPVHTKWLTRLLDTSRSISDVLTPDELAIPTFETVCKYIRHVIRKKLTMLGHASDGIVSHDMPAQSKLCAWIAALSKDAIIDRIGNGVAPTKELLTKPSASPECRYPIITNFGASLL